ncbi:MAG: YraN family protein [bacterium]|nr:YraN family protein [Candidatus Sumerlaeota bacterium]
MPSRKTHNKIIADLGEQAAERFLRRVGLRIIERNFRCRSGEIDIIAEEAGVIVFAEVKTRSPCAVLPPEDAVNEDKRRRIKRAAAYYLSNFRDPVPVRYDIVSVLVDARDAVTEIRHKKDAFR